MSKIKTTFILALLLTTVFTAFFPLAEASIGYIKIVGPANVPAGGTVTLNFTSVTFSGGQFYLVWSKDGFSQISSGDFKFSPVFNVVDLFGTQNKTITGDLGNYTIGKGYITGPIPKEIAGGKYYVKAFDGSATSVAVTNTYITVIPSLEVIPSSGPGGCSLTINGYAFTANDYANLTYNYDTTWVTVQNLTKTDSIGRFTYTMAAPDLKTSSTPSINPSGTSPWASVDITFYAQDNSTLYIASATYTEYARGLLQVGDFKPLSGNFYGNGTDFTGAAFGAGLNLHVFDSLIIAGNYFYPGKLNILFDAATPIGTAVTNGTGFFNTTVTIPIAAQGKHNITLVDANSVIFFFYLKVVPTLVLTPSEGPVGTVVTAKAYAFPANKAVYIYWKGEDYSKSSCYYWMANATTGSDGQFNVTVKFTVPHTYGGDHGVNATDTYQSGELTGLPGTPITSTVFTVTPTLTIAPSVFTNDGSQVTVTGTGLDPHIAYVPNIDNQRALSLFKANNTGDAVLEFVAAGFTPGVHVFSLYSGDLKASLEAFVLFNVTGVSPDTKAILNQLATNQADLLAQLKSLSDKIATLSNSVDSVKTTLTAGVQGIRSDIAGVKNDVATLSDSMSKGFSGVNSAIGTLSSSVDSMGKSLSSQITGLGNTLSKSISDNANSIQTSIKNAQDAVSSQVKSSVGDLSTFLIIIGILAAITLVIEAAILIRRLS